MRGLRNVVVFGVLGDMTRGRPGYATFASYDEVAHHSGRERADTLEALRKLDQQLGGPQTRPFILQPARLPAPDEPIRAAAALHG